jgi:hypothetical protein
VNGSPCKVVLSSVSYTLVASQQVMGLSGSFQSRDSHDGAPTLRLNTHEATNTTTHHHLPRDIIQDTERVVVTHTPI